MVSWPCTRAVRRILVSAEGLCGGIPFEPSRAEPTHTHNTHAQGVHHPQRTIRRTPTCAPQQSRRRSSDCHCGFVSFRSMQHIPQKHRTQPNIPIRTNPPLDDICNTDILRSVTVGSAHVKRLHGGRHKVFFSPSSLVVDGSDSDTEHGVLHAGIACLLTLVGALWRTTLRTNTRTTTMTSIPSPKHKHDHQHSRRGDAQTHTRSIQIALVYRNKPTSNDSSLTSFRSWDTATES